MSDQQFQKMQDIGDLFFRRLNDELSESDRIKLDEWMDQQDPVNRQFFEEMTEWEQVQAALQTMYQFDEAAAWEDLQKKIHVENVLAISTSIGTDKLSGRKYKYLAAAIFIGLIVAGSVLFSVVKNNSKSPVNKLTLASSKDLLPGGNKAILTLSNGDQINLEDSKDGKLAQQGISQIVKVNSAISYTTKNLHEKPIGELQFNTLTTPRAGTFMILLPDNSKVYLNSVSSLHYPVSFSKLKDRTVELRGEAYFEVAADASKPFRVKLGDRVVEVLGTSFNVQAYSDEPSVQTTLVTGAVRVQDGTNQAVLKPGQQAVFNSQQQGGKIVITQVDNLEKLISWKNGYFFFQNDDIQSIMRRISRWYDVDIEYEGKITSDKFSGTVKMDEKASELLNLLAMGGIHYRLEDKKIIVLP